MNAHNPNRLAHLLERRYHGAVNIAGIRFQLMYSLLRAFDLYKPNAPSGVRLEGIEDVDISQHRHIDLKGITISNQYIQVKTSKHHWDWSKFSGSGILQNFIPTWQADQSATLLVVSNFGYEGNLAELVKFCQGQQNHLSKKLKDNIINLLKREKKSDIDPLEFLKRISFFRISEEDLIQQSFAAIVKYFELHAPSPDIYFQALMVKMIDWATTRHDITRSDLDSVRLFVGEQIERGPHNLAIQNGWIGRLVFASEKSPEDFFEGKNARPGHIFAGLDVHRPIWEDRIDKALQRSQVCIIRASSGQGKSTLIYRYAFDHYNPETTFIIKHLADESMVGPVKQAIATYLLLNLPLLVIIDNVEKALMCWSNLAAEFAGQDVRFLITMREEDWYRYSSDISGFVWEVVKPELSFQEAQHIFAKLKSQGRVAPGVSSALWAFEKVQDRKLLLEFTYLVTHGRMLAERLQDQVLGMQRLGEDKAKTEILRLVSVAHAYNAKVKVQTIIANVNFIQDPDITLSALDNEYLIITNGTCEGLHIIRSQHLIPLLHSSVPITNTISNLIRILDIENLEIFVDGVFSDVTINHVLLLDAVKERCRRSSLIDVNRLIMALFIASEAAYYRDNHLLFDKGFERIGTSGIMLLCLATLPFQTIKTIQDLQQIFPSNPNFTLIDDLAKQFMPRQTHNRFEYLILRDIVENLSEQSLRENISRIGTLLGWCQLIGVDSTRLVKMLVQQDWRALIYQSGLIDAGNLLRSLHDYAFEAYQNIIDSEKAKLISYYKLVSDTIFFEERNGDAYIEFIVDESTEHTAHEQALERLRNLSNYFPDYKHYGSQGHYPSIYGLEPPVDDTTKNIPTETLQLEIHAPKNAAYFNMVDSHYSCQSMYDWQEEWFALRDMLSASIKKSIQFYENLFQSKQNANIIRELNTLIQKVLLAALHIRNMPSSFTQQFKEEQKAISDWETSINTYLRQFGEHDPNDAKQRQSSLMRYNLKEAVKKMPEMHWAFHKILTTTLAIVETEALDSEEKENYSYLADVLDIWFEHKSLGVNRNLRSVISEYRQSRHDEFMSALHSTLLPLENQGYHFKYPTQPINNHPLVDLYLGIEVLDFEHVFEQVIAIIDQLASFPLECSFANFVPLFNGSRYIPNIWRISFDNIKKIHEGMLENPTWSLLPIDAPPSMAEALPDIKEITLDEVKIHAEFNSIYAALNIARNTIYLIYSRLDFSQQFEVQLADKYRQRVDNNLRSISTDITTLSNCMTEIGTNNKAGNEWSDYCEACIQRLRIFAGVESVHPESFEPVRIWQDVELQNIFGRYLNARYLKT